MRRRLISSAIALGVTVSMAGCGKSPEYAVPETVCGVSVPEKFTSPLLPKGETLSEEGDVLPTKQAQCKLVVDHVPEMYLHFNPTRRPVDPMGELVSYRFRDRKEINKLPFDGEGAVGDYSAFISIQCDGEGPPYFTVAVSVTQNHDSQVVPRDDIEHFAVAYASRAKEKLGCRR